MFDYFTSNFLGKQLESSGDLKPKRHAPDPDKFDFDREALLEDVNSRPAGKVSISERSSTNLKVNPGKSLLES